MHNWLINFNGKTFKNITQNSLTPHPVKIHKLVFSDSIKVTMSIQLLIPTKSFFWKIRGKHVRSRKLEDVRSRCKHKCRPMYIKSWTIFRGMIGANVVVLGLVATIKAIQKQRLTRCKDYLTILENQRTNPCLYFYIGISLIKPRY